MGNIFVVGCPKGFQQVGEQCVAKCPEEKGFKLVTEGSTFKCVNQMDSRLSVTLTPLGVIMDLRKEDGSNSTEPTFDVLKQDRPQLYEQYMKEKERTDREFSKANNITVRSLIDKLKPFRPPTAPASDIEKERKAIIKQSSISLIVVQVALFSLVLSLIVYIFVPSSSAHLLVFLILSVAIALVFFLKK